jgi:hypothetical protein
MNAYFPHKVGPAQYVWSEGSGVYRLTIDIPMAYVAESCAKGAIRRSLLEEHEIIRTFLNELLGISETPPQ